MNPHKKRAQVGGDRSRSIFGTPAYIVTIEHPWRYDASWTHHHEGAFQSSCPEIHQWLIENVGEEWVDWAVSLTKSYTVPEYVITLAFKDQNKALHAIMRFGKITPTLS